jgi:hypothetical protein
MMSDVVVRGLLRHHSALAKIALGAGFTYGFVYTTNHGQSPFEAMAYGSEGGAGGARAGAGEGARASRVVARDAVATRAA